MKKLKNTEPNRYENDILERATKNIKYLLTKHLHPVTDCRPFRIKRGDERGAMDPYFYIDHLYLDDDGKITQHPYHADMEQLNKLYMWCQANNYCFYITGNSEYFPASTFKITFVKLTDEEIKRKREKFMKSIGGQWPKKGCVVIASSLSPEASAEIGGNGK